MFHHFSLGLRRWVLLAVVLILAGAGVWGYQRQANHEAEIHYHAVFQVYDGETRLDFSDLQYQHVEACTGEHDDDPSPEEEQLEKAHLHDSVDDVVHVHRADAVWGDLFQNMNYSLGTPVRGYVNGQAVDDILTAPIQTYDRVLILVGENPADIQSKLDGVPSVEYIEAQERFIESC